MITKAADVRKWLEEQVASQAEQEPHLPPVFTLASVKRKVKSIKVRWPATATHPPLARSMCTTAAPPPPRRRRTG